jgi:MFS family permease
MTYILVLFADRGVVAGWAALAASCVGPAQVFGRLMLMLGGVRVSNRAATFVSIGSLVLASIVLIAAGAAPWLIFLFAALQGAGAGLFSILRPVLVGDLLGKSGFGAVSSAMSVGPVLANAAAPALGAALFHIGGADLTLAICLALPVFALGLAALMLRRSVV